MSGVVRKSNGRSTRARSMSNGRSSHTTGIATYLGINKTSEASALFKYSSINPHVIWFSNIDSSLLAAVLF